MSGSRWVLLILLFSSLGDSFLAPSWRPRIRIPATRTSLWQSSPWSEESVTAARSFKILTCSATSCAAKRKSLSLDPFATFSAFWERLEAAGWLDIVAIEETSCLGACQRSPCVAVEHQDYEGTVALAGMEPAEFVDRVFHGVTDDEDVDRVWGILLQAIQTVAMDEMEDDDEEVPDNYV